MGGAVVFAGQLLPLLRFPLDFDYIHVSRYGNEIARREIDWRVPPRDDVRGRTVLVLDDILDDGDTHGGDPRAAARDGRARAFYCAVLVEKDARPRRSRSRADFVGLQIPDRFVFGCGMDAKGFWRNLPEIRAHEGRMT